MPDDFAGDDLEDGELSLGELGKLLLQPPRDAERGSEGGCADVSSGGWGPWSWGSPMRMSAVSR
jgi:hypothetical protein